MLQYIFTRQPKCEQPEPSQMGLEGPCKELYLQPLLPFPPVLAEAPGELSSKATGLGAGPTLIQLPQQ